MSEKLTYEDQVAISRELKTIARMVEKRLERVTGKRVGFSVWTWGGNRSQYVSNCERQDIKNVLMETIDRWSEDDGPFHKTAN